MYMQREKGLKIEVVIERMRYRIRRYRKMLIKTNRIRKNENESERYLIW